MQRHHRPLRSICSLHQIRHCPSPTSLLSNIAADNPHDSSVVYNKAIPWSIDLILCRVQHLLTISIYQQTVMKQRKIRFETKLKKKNHPLHFASKAISKQPSFELCIHTIKCVWIRPIVYGTASSILFRRSFAVWDAFYKCYQRHKFALSAVFVNKEAHGFRALPQLYRLALSMRM